jgi:hypothetical protein
VICGRGLIQHRPYAYSVLFVRSIASTPSRRLWVSGALIGVAAPIALATAAVGGTLTNGSANLVRWHVDPRAVDEHSAMPVTGIIEAEARVVAAYLPSKH